MVADRPYVRAALGAIEKAYSAITHMGVTDCEGRYRQLAMDACLAAIKHVQQGHAHAQCDHKPNEWLGAEDAWTCACKSYVFPRMSRDTRL